MKRSKLDGTTSRLENEDDDDKLCEKRALISDDEEEICDRGIVNRRRIKNGFEMKGISSEPNIEYTYYDIQPGDSLQSICLRYTCPVSQVKRLNGLMTDQEFYGLRRLKLPLGKLALLEDALMQQDLIQMHESNNNGPQKCVNSPGSALSITNPRFKPLLSPMHSSDNIRATNLPHNSHSFTSLRDFDHKHDKNVSIDLGAITPHKHPNSSLLDTNGMRHKTFIKSDISIEDAQITIDTLLTDTELQVPNVFEDLDYHVEKARAAAEHYDKRAVELADSIDINSDGQSNPTTRVSKIPELFFSGENFGLNLTKLIALIFFICLVIPLVYMNQVNVIKKQL